MSNLVGSANDDEEQASPPDILNSFFGWQPTIPETMNCSWRLCFQSDHNCSSCRDTIEDFGSAPVAPDDWIPDVTVLHRMMLAGKDSNRQPWPPALDSELCEDIGADGGNVDISKELLEKVPIEAKPLSPSDSTPTVMCIIYSMEVKHATNIRAMRETWAPYCDGFLVFSTASDPRIPAIYVPHDGPEDYHNMWQKVRSIWRFVGTHYLESFDFFYIGGEDLFVIPQNLKRYFQMLLKEGNKTREDDFFVGRRFKGGGSIGYFNTGGAGYALSRGTFRKFFNEGLDNPRCSPGARSSMEDVMIAHCLKDVFNIGLTDTRDHELRERFHHFPPEKLYLWRPRNDWYANYNVDWPPMLGAMSSSPSSVSFHYIRSPAMVRHLHALINACHGKE